MPAPRLLEFLDPRLSFCGALMPYKYSARAGTAAVVGETNEQNLKLKLLHGAPTPDLSDKVLRCLPHDETLPPAHLYSGFDVVRSILP